MKKIQIKLSAIGDPVKLPNILAKYTNVDFDLQQGRYIVDAKSLMGIYALDLLKPIDLVINSDDDTIINGVCGDLKEWTV